MNKEKEFVNELKNKEIRILPYAHCDYAALHSRYWHKVRYNEIFDRVISLLDEMPEFRWYFDCYRSQLKAIFEKYPEKKKIFDKHVASGRLNFIGAYANIRPNMVGEETYIRNLFLGRNTLPNAVCEIYGEEVDVALGHAQIPQILSQFGYKLYKIYRPCDVFEAKNVPSAFIWKGFDGSKIAVVRCDYSAFDWTGTENVNTPDEAIEYVYNNAKNPLKYSTSNLVWVNCGCDDTFPFKTNQANNNGTVYDVDMQKVISLYPSNLNGSIKMASPTEFYKELKGYLDELKTLNGDIDCCDVSYNVAVNGEKGFVPLRLKADELLVRAERWTAFAKKLGIEIPFDFDAEWEILLTACCHATQWMFSVDFYEMRTALQTTIRNTEVYLRKLANEIAKKIDAPKHTLKTVFNDSPYAEYKDVTITVPCADIDELVLSDGKGEILPFEVISSHDYMNSWEFTLKLKIFLPPYGYNVIYAKGGDTRAINGKQCTPKQLFELQPLPTTLNVVGGGFHLTFENGNLTKANEHTATADRPFNALTFYRYKYCGSWWEEPTGYKNEVVWENYKLLKTTENTLKIELYGKIEDMPVIQTISATNGNKVLEFNVNIDWHKDNAYLASSIPVDGLEEVYCDIPFGTQTVNIVEEYSPKMVEQCIMHRKRKGVFCAKSFANAKNNGKDVSVIRDNSDRYFIGDIDKNTLGTVLINSIVRTEGTWEVDINDDIEAVGNHDLKYKVLFGKPSLSILDKITPSIFTSDIARENPPVSNKLSPYLSLFDISVEDGTLITAITNDENGLTLRLAQTTGQTQKVIIPANGYNACTSQLFSGEKVLEIEKANDSFTYTLKPFEIITLKLK